MNSLFGEFVVVVFYFSGDYSIMLRYKFGFLVKVIIVVLSFVVKFVESVDSDELVFVVESVFLYCI